MRFFAVHKAATYLMAAAAFLALALSGELPTGIMAIGALGLTGSWWWEAPRVRLERWSWVWNVLALSGFGYALLQALGSGEWIVGGAGFLTLLLVAKMFMRRSSRDYQWVYVLTFLMLVAGTTLNAELSYAVCFLAYVIFATWALILFHLRREMEDNFLLKHSTNASSERVEVERILNSRRIVGGRFLLATAAASLAIFVTAALLFLLFPRVGFGLFFQRGKGHMTFAGFSETVALGGHGLIRNDDTVVMRVKLDDPRWHGPLAPELHWRAVAFDRYADGKWSRSGSAFRGHGRAQVLPGTTRALLDGAARFPELVGTLRQEIFLEALDTTALFGASMPVAFELANTAPGVAATGEFAPNDEVRFRHYSGLRYVAYSDALPPPPGRLALAPDADPKRMAPYLQLPPELPARVRQLGIELTRGRAGPYAKAEAIAAYLRHEFRYTLFMDTDESQEPLDHFLFERKQGHCEYFSTAMAILLRAAGVPTRNVDGFLGGEWNEYGQYVAVRGGDAHSWVEVWFDGVGWVTYDPTPPSPEVALTRGGGDLLDKIRRLFDTLRLSWFKWVVDYDLHRQLGLLRGLAETLGFGAEGRLNTKAISNWLRAQRGTLAITGGVLAGLVATFVLLRRRRRGGSIQRPGRRRPHPVVALHTRAERELARRGFPRPAARTAREHARGLAERGIPGAAPYSDLTELYYIARYSESPAMIDAIDLVAAQKLAAEIRRPPVTS